MEQSPTDWLAEKTEMFVFPGLESGSLRSRCWLSWFLLKPLFLAHRQPLLSRSVLTEPLLFAWVKISTDNKGKYYWMDTYPKARALTELTL